MKRSDSACDIHTAFALGCIACAANMIEERDLAMNKPKLTQDEKDRLRLIRANLNKFKQAQYETGTWESAFFLSILDKFGIK